jgi:hypothetical protein
MKSPQCSFCAIADPALPVLRGPGELSICLYCLIKARNITANMTRSYVCSFCGKSVAGASMAEGPGRIHVCSDCVEAALATFRNEAPKSIDASKNHKT